MSTQNSHDRFTFTITDVARFLGKSPVTLRAWERKGEAYFDRDSGGDRKLTADQVRGVAKSAANRARISKHRRRLIDATMTLIELIERENG